MRGNEDFALHQAQKLNRLEHEAMPLWVEVQLGFVDNYDSLWRSFLDQAAGKSQQFDLGRNSSGQQTPRQVGPDQKHVETTVRFVAHRLNRKDWPG